MNTKKFDISILTIWSLFISYIIKLLYGLTPLNEDSIIAPVLYIVTGLILSFILTWLKQTSFVNKIIPNLNHKSLNDDIFDNVIDYDKKTMLMVYLKSQSNICYLGRFAFREEKGNDSWISLFEYCTLDSATHDKVYDPDECNLKSSVVIPLSNVARIEIIYEDDSDVWKRVS